MNIHVQFGFNHTCVFVVSEKKAFEHFPIGSNVNKNRNFVEDHPRNIPAKENVQMPSSQKLQIHMYD
jgi:hypothetical protein